MRVTRPWLDRWSDLVYVPKYPQRPIQEVWTSGITEFTEYLELIDEVEGTKFNIQRELQRKKATRIGPNRLSV